MRRKRPIDRTQPHLRDTTLVVIASEDQYAVKQYFEFFRSTRIQFHVLETVDGHSAPKAVLDRLETFMKEHEIGEGDEFWYVTDTDHWSEPGHIQNLREVVRLCRQKQIGVAMSNPCFDLWLLLHFADFPHDRGLTCADIGREIGRICGSFDKRRVFNLPIDQGRVEDAVRRATAHPPAELIPTEPSTAMHELVGPLLARLSVAPRPRPSR